jgi:preprotein translocase subunit SecD
MEKALTQRLDSYVSELKSRMRTEKIRYRLVKRENESSITMKFKKEAEREAALSFVQSNYPEFIRRTTEKDGDFFLNLSLSEAKIKEIKTYAIEQNLTTLRNRVNELGVAEPLIQRQGSDRIVVELPGVQDTAAAKRVLGQTANLEMRLEAKSDASPATTEEFGWRNNPARPPARLEKDVIIRGDNVSNANAAFDQNGLPQVNITLDSIGGRRMGDITRTSVGRRMAVLFVEQHSTVIKKMVNGKEVDKRINKETKKIISLATIQSAFSNSFRITGLDSAAESSELALLLRAGSLAAPVYFVEERTVGPSMGQHNINSGILSVEIGFALVLIFMIAFYRLFGLVANIALMANVVMIIACMSLISATLTMPGIAGIVLTVGMAVDANVLIYERIKEELANGMSPQAAIEAGYDRAFTTIFDANITTLIAAVILFAVGTGPVKGFAVTLSLGIITSMFTAIMLTRSIINKIYGGRKITRLSIGYTYTKQSKAVQGKSS